MRVFDPQTRVSGGQIGFNRANDSLSGGSVPVLFQFNGVTPRLCPIKFLVAKYKNSFVTEIRASQRQIPNTAGVKSPKSCDVLRSIHRVKLGTYDAELGIQKLGPW